MRSHGLNTAVELYRTGTLSLAAAARHAGRSEEELLDALHTAGGCVARDAGDAEAGPTGVRPSAD